MNVLQFVACAIGVVGATYCTSGCINMQSCKGEPDRLCAKGPRCVEIGDYGWVNIERKARRSRIAFAPDFRLNMEGFAHDELAEQRYQNLLDALSRVPLSRLQLNSITLKEIGLEWFAYVDYAYDNRTHAKLIFAFSRMYNEWIAMYSDANTLAN